MLTAIHTRAEVKSGSVIEVQAPGVPAGTTVEVIILFAQARHEGSMPRVLSDRAQAIERAKGLLRVRDQAPDDDDIQELLEQAFFAGSAVPAITPAELCREIINDAIRRELQEDAQDLAAFADRADEQTLSYEAFLAKPKADGTP